jgi:signal transduction histidine kinase
MTEIETSRVANAVDQVSQPAGVGPIFVPDRRANELWRTKRDEMMSSADKINILVVDDLPDKLLAFSSILEELGQNVVTARSGEEALRRVLELDFAVILLDVNMPGMDGFETATLIRRRKKSAHTPIIFITAFADEMHAARGYSLGAVDYILAPVVPETLRTKVKVFVELFRMAQQVRRQADERVALARAQAARAAAEEATRRSAFLAEASKVLSNSLDVEATFRGLLRLAVPYLGDLGGVALTDDHGQWRHSELTWVGVASERCGKVMVGEECRRAPLADVGERVLATGQSTLIVDLNQGPTGPPMRRLREGDPVGPDFALSSAVVVPLLARGKPLGVLSLAVGPSGRSFDAADMALAEDLAARAAIAIDNARLYQNVQEADRRKNEFLAMLAHELRNPLAPIRNAVEILRLRAPDHPDLNKVRDMIQRQVQLLVRLVDDLLDISRITRGRIQLRTEPVDVAAVVERAVETVRPLVDARRHRLTISLPPEPLGVQGDPVRLAQILGNLLNNAAKYTGEGGSIALTGERQGAEVVLRVRDNGIGIPAPMLASIFDLFTQVERSLDRSEGGLGIGLTLVRRLVEMHGGSVQAFSPGPKQGSEFVVRLPALAGEPPPPHAAQGRARPSLPRSLSRILIVDDYVDASDSLLLLLQQAGHEVEVAHDGPAALEAVAAFQPEVVLLDIGLPGMDGYEVARRLRQQPGGKELHIVALTGYGQAEDQRCSREAGFDQHLVKPVDPVNLLTLLASVTSASPHLPEAP